MDDWGCFADCVVQWALSPGRLGFELGAFSGDGRQPTYWPPSKLATLNQNVEHMQLRAHEAAPRSKMRPEACAQGPSSVREPSSIAPLALLVFSPVRGCHAKTTRTALPMPVHATFPMPCPSVQPQPICAHTYNLSLSTPCPCMQPKPFHAHACNLFPAVLIHAT
ncbi:hypothetical protein DUNSADRAFT_8492 [Dunaliella salina]|uniref:Encoded protein n=1 Tax=Dunaliella salina TaxID=3046 RepID=A0ABQ7GJD0_DUNSA|nr:hypothetical protein DUNSADRAFT_8492 [Dunaliella salina]|eukprot:KAF5834722.1 hypothetical protein DUNSADRAFT_8492 [Dunaliella salina]